MTEIFIKSFNKELEKIAGKSFLSKHNAIEGVKDVIKSMKNLAKKKTPLSPSNLKVNIDGYLKKPSIEKEVRKGTGHWTNNIKKTPQERMTEKQTNQKISTVL